jgi:hypothetical protein
VVRTWFTVAGIGLALWLLQALFAWCGKMLTPKQMQKYGIEQGVPFTGHGSTWFVLFGLIPLIATLYTLFAPEWTSQEWVLGGIFGFIISAGMHFVYTKVPFPDYMVKNGRLSWAGNTHFVLFTGAITVLALFFFATLNPPPALVLFTSWYMIGHVFVGNHMLTRMHPPSWFPPYKFWDPGAWGPILAVVAIFSFGAWYVIA